MKKSKAISLVLITAALASCHRPPPDDQWTAGERHVYMRSDSTASYYPDYYGHSWYLAFRPYGDYYNGYYHRVGYYSDAISRRSNFGSNFAKSSISRGGFGGGHMSVSS